MLQKIEELSAQIAQLTAASAAEVDELRNKYLSKKGIVAQLMNDFRSVTREFGSFF